jgi:hypothetical protein
MVNWFSREIDSILDMSVSSDHALLMALASRGVDTKAVIFDCNTTASQSSLWSLSTVFALNTRLRRA